MRILLIFFAVYSFGDIANTILKINHIENVKKHFLKINYNIFTNNTQFITFTPTIKENKINLKIYAIFNQKVNINGKWYQIGNEINGYKIINITSNSVLLKKGSKILVLKIKNNILKVTQ